MYIEYILVKLHDFLKERKIKLKDEKQKKKTD